MESYFPKDMSNFSLSDFEQNILGYYYLKSYENNNISLSQYDSNSYNIVNALKSLISKNLIKLSASRMELNITPFGSVIAEMISKNPSESFSVDNLSFNNLFDLYFKYYNGSGYSSSCEPDISRYVYTLLLEDKIQVFNGNIFKSGDRYIISNNDKITESRGRHSSSECFCDYVTFKVPRKSKSSGEIQYFICNISLNKLFEILPKHFFNEEDIESDDPVYLKLKKDYIAKKQYYEDNKTNLEMIKSLTNNSIDFIKEPTFDYKIYKYLIPAGEGKILGNKLRNYSGFNIPYKQH